MLDLELYLVDLKKFACFARSPPVLCFQFARGLIRFRQLRFSLQRVNLVLQGIKVWLILKALIVPLNDTNAFWQLRLLAGYLNGDP